MPPQSLDGGQFIGGPLKHHGLGLLADSRWLGVEEARFHPDQASHGHGVSADRKCRSAGDEGQDLRLYDVVVIPEESVTMPDDPHDPVMPD
jgi:hypothetical protein